MQKRYIKKPGKLPVYLNDGTTQAKDKDGMPAWCTFDEFIKGRTEDLAYVADPDPDLNQPGRPSPRFVMVDIVSGDVVRRAFRAKEDNEWVTLDEDDYQRLKRATEKGNYNQLNAASVISFMQVIADAKTTKPAEAPESAPEEKAEP